MVGDGSSTLEELILRDDRAVAIAEVHLRQQHGRLTEVPADGQEVQLVEVGAHSRGTIFLDGRHLATPELANAIHRLGRSLEGFDFGRFDLRVADAATLQRGGPFRMIEVNGVTSEATHIYDPRLGILQAWTVLSTQWRVAVEIGAERRREGVQPATIRELLEMAWAYRATRSGRGR